MNSTPSLVFIAILGIALFASLMLQLQSAPSLLYMQDAGSGTLVPSEDGDPTHFTLTLNTIQPFSTYYSDRLDRLTGRIRTSNFIRIEGLFEREDPPDAVIILPDSEDPEANAIAVELYNPRHDRIQQQLIYDVVVLDDAPTYALGMWSGELDSSLPESFGRVRVIIDRASFDLDNIMWTFQMVDEGGQVMPGIPLTLDYTTLSGDEQSRTRSTNENGQVTFSLPSTFNVAAILTYTSPFDAQGDVMVYAIPIMARCSGDFTLVFGDEPDEGQSLTLPCEVSN